MNKSFNGKNVRQRAAYVQDLVSKYQKLVKRAQPNLNPKQLQYCNQAIAYLQKYQQRIASGENIQDKEISYQTNELDRYLGRANATAQRAQRAEWDAQEKAAEEARRNPYVGNNGKTGMYTNPETGQQFEW